MRGMLLVTGGTGFVGQALLPALVQAWREVRVLTRQSHVVLPDRVAPFTGDLFDPPSMQAALGGITTVVHLAAAVAGNQRQTRSLHDVNVTGTRQLARAAARAGVRRFVHISSAGVYGDGASLTAHDEATLPRPETMYEKTKLEGERVVQEELASASVPWVILRPTGVHGSGRAATLSFYRQISRQRVWIHGPTRVIVHPTHVDDLVHAIMLTLSKPELAGEIVNIAGPEALSYPALIQRVADRMGVRTRQLQLPTQPLRAMAGVAATALRQVGMKEPRLERLSRPVVNRSVDTAKARRLLGFEPSPLDRGIDATIAWARREAGL